MLPENTQAILSFLGYVSYRDFLVAIIDGVVTLEWFHADPQPSDQAIIDAGNDLTTIDGQVFSQWDGPNMHLRRAAREHLAAASRESVVQRASDIEIGLYARDAHRNLNALLDGILAANNLADVKAVAAAIAQSPAPADDATFVSGARAAIVARIDAGEGDS